MHSVKDFLALDTDGDLHFLPQLLQQHPQVAHGHLGFLHIHSHDHGEGALQDGLGNIQDIDVVFGQQSADGGQEFTFNMSSNATMSLNGTAMVMTEGCDANSGKLFRMIEVIEGRTVEAIMIDESTAKVGASKDDVVVYALYSDKMLAVVDKPVLGGEAVGENGILKAGQLTATALGKTANCTIA